MNTKIIVTAKSFEGELEFCYDYTSGVLVRFECRAQLSDVQIDWFGTNMPMRYQDLTAFCAKSKNLHVNEVVEIPTFEQFWDAYSYKVDKQLAIKAWDKLGIADMHRAMAAIVSYDNYLKRTGIAKIYPCRYISDRKFENDYKKLGR